MKKRQVFLLMVLAGGLVLAILLLWNGQSHSPESAARQKLDNLLGQTDSDPPADEMPSQPNLPAMPGWGGAIWGLASSAFDAAGAGVSVEEDAERYRIRVPLASEKDAEQVKLSVTPHRIEIAGQTGQQEGGSRFTSSFMQSFTTSSAVKPEAVSKKIQRDGDKRELVITIPKDMAGSKAGASLEERQALPRNRMELPESDVRKIDPELLEPSKTGVI